jgi:hypothetical protein
MAINRSNAKHEQIDVKIVDLEGARADGEKARARRLALAREIFGGISCRLVLSR